MQLCIFVILKKLCNFSMAYIKLITWGGDIICSPSHPPTPPPATVILGTLQALKTYLLMNIWSINGWKITFQCTYSSFSCCNDMSNDSLLFKVFRQIIEWNKYYTYWRCTASYSFIFILQSSIHGFQLFFPL